MKIQVFIINNYAREGDEIHGVSKRIEGLTHFIPPTNIRVLPNVDGFRVEEIIFDLMNNSYEIYLSIDQYVSRGGKMTEQNRETLFLDFYELVEKFGWEYIGSNRIHTIK